MDHPQVCPRAGDLWGDQHMLCVSVTADTTRGVLSPCALPGAEVPYSRGTVPLISVLTALVPSTLLFHFTLFLLSSPPLPSLSSSSFFSFPPSLSPPLSPLSPLLQPMATSGEHKNLRPKVLRALLLSAVSIIISQQPTNVPVQNTDSSLLGPKNL